MRRLLFFCFFTINLFCSPSAQQENNGLFIVIHGTWATDTSWCKSGGDFFDALEKTANELGYKVTCFTWTGNLDHTSRYQAAQDLIKLIHSYPQDTKLNIVAHSHGGNVAIQASHELAKYGLNCPTIDCFYTLGTPVNTISYMPNMKVISSFYNLFSFEDLIQPCLGMYGRLYTQHPRIANIRVQIDGIEPGHSELHNPTIGSWLPLLHEIMANSKANMVNFTLNRAPELTQDLDREKMLRRDQEIFSTFQNIASRAPATHKS